MWGVEKEKEDEEVSSGGERGMAEIRRVQIELLAVVMEKGRNEMLANYR